jgi:glycosyltransferase involved in cell wall biosynthesis
MRVLNSLTDPRVGGPQVLALGVAERLREHGIETVFLLPEGTDAFEERAAEAGFTVVRPGLARLNPPRDIIANARYVVKFPVGVERIRRIIDRYSVDLVHASMTLNYQAVAAAKQASVPLAWLFNDTGTPWPLNRLTGHAARLFADEIGVAAEAVHPYFFPESIHSRVIYSPVDVAEFDPNEVEPEKEQLRAELGIETGRPVIGTVGNINPIKGHIHLLRSIAQLEERYGPVTVPIVGRILDSRSEYFEKLKRLRTQLGLDDTVNFIGYRSDIPQILSLLDVFVLPSVAEACPISVLEAMAMERPVVATRVGGVPEQIVDGEHGWIVPPADPDALANALGEVLQSPAERRDRGKAARRRAVSRFSMEECVERHVELYHNALAKSN